MISSSETVTAITMPYKNTKAMAHSPDEDIVIVPGVLHDDTLAPYLSINSLKYVLRTLTKMALPLIRPKVDDIMQKL